jgi:hypothetical protein
MRPWAGRYPYSAPLPRAFTHAFTLQRGHCMGGGTCARPRACNPECKSVLAYECRSEPHRLIFCITTAAPVAAFTPDQGPWAMNTEPWNDPNIGPHEFLLACMHDPALPLPTRINAADHLMRQASGICPLSLCSKSSSRAVCQCQSPWGICVSISMTAFAAPRRVLGHINAGPWICGTWSASRSKVMRDIWTDITSKGDATEGCGGRADDGKIRY